MASTLSVKMAFGDDTRRFNLDLDASDASTFSALLQRACSMYGLEPARTKLSFKDDEGDYVTLVTPEDLAVAFEVLKLRPGDENAGKELLRIRVATLMSVGLRLVPGGNGKQGKAAPAAVAKDREDSSSSAPHDREKLPGPVRRALKELPVQEEQRKTLRQRLRAALLGAARPQRKLVKEVRGALAHFGLADKQAKPLVQAVKAELDSAGASASSGDEAGAAAPASPPAQLLATAAAAPEAIRAPLLEAIRSSYPLAPALRAVRGGPILPAAVREELDKLPAGGEAQRLRRELRAGFFGQPAAPAVPAVGRPEAPAAAPVTSVGEDQKLAQALAAAAGHPVLQVAIRAAWPPAPSNGDDPNDKTLPQGVRAVLRTFQAEEQRRVRQALRAVWFGEANNPAGRWGNGNGNGNRRHAPGPMAAVRAAAGEKKKLLARFVSHETLPDEAPVPPGAHVTKIWRVRNDSAVPWPLGYPTITCVSGEDNELFVQPVLVEESLAPGEETLLSLDLVTPAKPGLYEAWFRLKHTGMGKFGQRLKCSLLVHAETGDEKTKQVDEKGATDTFPHPTSTDDEKEAVATDPETELVTLDDLAPPTEGFVNIDTDDASA